MKVVCESCQAVYAIEDGLIPPRGARAQCPRCGHQQRVMPGAQPSTPPPAAPQAPPLWEPPVTSSRPGAAAVPPPPADFTPAGGISIPPPPPPPPPAIAPVSLGSVRPAATPAPAAGETCEQCGKALVDPFDKALGVCDDCRQKQDARGGVASSAKPSPSGPKPAVGPSPSGPRPIAGPSQSGPRPIAGPSSGPKPAAVAKPAAEQPSLDKIDELFDAAMADTHVGPAPSGPRKLTEPDVPAPAPSPLDQVFEAAVADSKPAKSPSSSGPKPVPAAAKPAADALDEVLGTAPANRAQPAAAQGGVEVNPADFAGQEPSVVVSDAVKESAPRPLASTPVSASGSRPAISLGTSGSRLAVAPLRTGAVSAARPTQRPGWIVPVVALVVLGVLGAVAFLERGRISAWMHPPVQGPAPLPEAVQAVVPRWRLAFVDLNGTAADYLSQGKVKLAQDSVPAYADAEELFQKALTLDPSSDDAIAGYVQALALGRGAQVDDVTYHEALGLVDAAQVRSKGKPNVLVAKANLLLTRGARDLSEQARELAQQAVAKAPPEEKAQAQLALGLSYVSTSARLALQHIDEALKSDPSSKRALYYRGLAHEAAGEYRAALKDFEARLAKDPDQAQAVAALVGLYEDAGESAQAKALLQKLRAQHPDDLHSAVTIAAITYQLEGKAKDATAQLRALLKDTSAPEEVRAEALVHLAAAERMAGNLAEAEAAAEQAVKLSGAKRPAVLQLFLLDLQRGRLSQAASRFEVMRQDKLLDPALLKLLEGRLLFAQGQDAPAAQAFTEASQLDPRRLDALIFSGVASVRAGRRDDGWQILTRAMQMDPSRLGPMPAVTIYYLEPRDTLDGAEGQLIKAGRVPEDVMPVLAEAFIRFHQRDLPTAERLLKESLELNNANGMAHAYQSLVLLGRGDRSAALKEGAEAVATGRQLAVTHYAYGEALAADSQLELAKKELRQAIEITPSFLGAECRLGELEAKSNEPAAVDGARARLVRVVGLDPTYLPAKRALFALDR